MLHRWLTGHKHKERKRQIQASVETFRKVLTFQPIGTKSDGVRRWRGGCRRGAEVAEGEEVKHFPL